MNLSKKVLYLSVFSSVLLSASFIHFVFSTRDYISWKKRVAKLTKHRRNVLRDQRWTKWRPSHEPVRYSILWLFNLDETCRIRHEESVEVHPGIHCIKLNLTCADPEPILKELTKPPFGKIAVKRVKPADGATDIELHWYWSKELTPNQTMSMPKDHMILTLDTIILLNKGWLVKLNNEWIRNDGNRNIKNVEILGVEQYTLHVEVRTPSGGKRVVLKCGDEVKVGYLEC